MRTLSDCQQLPAALKRHEGVLITLLELGDEKDLPPDALEALRVIIDELKALPAWSRQL